jgi:hypothetical protein
MKEMLKIGLFIFITSIFLSACADKVIQKNSKSKTKNLTETLKDSFDFDENQKLYKNKSAITTNEDSDNLIFKFEKFCNEKKGELIYTDFYINQDYMKSNYKNKTNVCEVNNEPYFFIQQSINRSDYIYSISIDEQTIGYYKNYKNNKSLNPETIEKMQRERAEIQRREIAREQKTRMILNKKDQKTMTFFDSWRYAGSEASCSKKCIDINIKNYGFKSLKDALSNNWQLVSKEGEEEMTLDDSCTCSGSSAVLSKK